MSCFSCLIVCKIIYFCFVWKHCLIIGYFKLIYDSIQTSFWILSSWLSFPSFFSHLKKLNHFIHTLFHAQPPIIGTMTSYQETLSATKAFQELPNCFHKQNQKRHVWANKLQTSEELQMRNTSLPQDLEQHSNCNNCASVDRNRRTIVEKRLRAQRLPEMTQKSMEEESWPHLPSSSPWW